MVAPDGTSLAVRAQMGTGGDVLFLHGRSRSLAHRSVVLEHLDHVRAVSIDLRRHRRADTGGSIAVDSLVTDANAVISGVGFDDPIVVGHSLAA